MSARPQQQPPPAPRPRPAGRIAMLITGILVGAVLATAVGVLALGLGFATVGDAEEVIEAPETTTSAEPTETETQTEAQTQTETAAGDVPEPCVRSAEYNITLDEQVDQLAVGARDEDARTIQEALDAIQAAREDSDGAAQECLDLAGSPAP